MKRYSGRSRRRGVIWVYTVLAMGLFMGCCSLVVDMGYRYYRKAEAQRAADAAALAGVVRLPDTTGAQANAVYYASQNGYNNTKTGVIVNCTFAPGGNPNQYEVYVGRTEPTFFTGLFSKSKPLIGARATAEYYSEAPMNISGNGTYGTAGGDVNLSAFGPTAYYNNGDPYDPMYLPKKGSTAPDPTNPNPQNVGWDGWNYGFTVPSNYASTFKTSSLVMEVFDPDCYNKGNTAVPDGDTTLDELRDSSGNASTSTSNLTTLRFRIYWDNNTPNDLSDDVLLGDQTYSATSTTYDMKWDPMFTVDTSKYTNGNYRFNVKPVSGSSENGYNLRVGPPHATTMTDASWNTTYGSKTADPVVTSTGQVEMNFNTTGSVKITLGAVPTEAAGGDLFVNKFDTDVAAKSITYTCSSLPGKSYAGTLSSDGTWKLDTIVLPSTYTTGTWYATYAAGQQDTSVWTMSFSNYVPGTPGRLHLVE